MTTYSLAYDLASRFSGAALVWEDGFQYWTCDSGPVDKANPQDNLLLARVWACKVARQVNDILTPGDNLYVTVENVSHYLTDPAPALRTQGMVLDRLSDFVHFPTPVLVMPAEWQNEMGWKKTEGSTFTSKTWAKWLCVALGYDVATTPGSKAAEDSRDAILIARWRLEHERASVT